MAKLSRARSVTVGLGAIAVATALILAGSWNESSDESGEADVNEGGADAIAGALESRAPSSLVISRPGGTSPMFVTFIGDSITSSWGASSFDRGYRPLLTAEWAQGGQVDPVVTAIQRGLLAEVAAVASIPSKSHVVIIALGTTDNANADTDPGVFREQYEALVERVRTTAPTAALVCLGTWRPSDADGALDSIIAGACQGQNSKYLTLVDIYQRSDSRGPEGRSIYLGGGVGDNFYPNDVGHAAIMERISTNVLVSPPDGAAG